jgi:iron(III) transport system substrate-binding protein
MKRIFGPTAIALGLLLAACGGSSAPASSSPGAGAARAKPAGSAQAAATGADAYETVKASAEKEGKVLWYDSLAQDQGDKILQAFMADYPNMKGAKYLEVPSGNRVARVTQESRAGGPTADVDFMNAAGSVAYHDQGFLMDVDWKALGIKTSPEETPNSYMVAVTAPMYGIYYNTKKVSEAESPKTMEDLLDPKWKGRIGTWARYGEMLTNYYTIWGPEKVLDYAKKFSAQQAKFLDSNFTIAQGVGSGEYDVSFTTYHTTLPTTAKGAPVKWNTLDPVPVSPLFGYVLKYGQYHDGGKLLLYWLAGPKGAQVYEDVSGRGNPFVPETKMAKMLGNAKAAQIPVDVAVKDADKINKLAEDVNKAALGK